MTRSLGLAALLLSACGYQPLYGGERPEERLSVVAGTALVARPELVHEALAGARSRLSRAGALEPGDSHPRLVVELLRLDEGTAGIVSAPAAGGRVPVGRGSRVGIVGRAWVVERPGDAPTRDTGDVRRVERHAAGADAFADSRANVSAARAAARALGDALAGLVLGEPEATIEPL